MFRYFLVAACLFHHAVAPAQQSYLDSCLTVLAAHPQEDTVRLNLLNDIAFEYNYTDPEKGLAYADQAILLATKLDISAKIAGSYSNKGVNYAAKGDDSMALAMYAQALLLHSQAGNQAGMAKVMNNMAIIYVGMSDYAQALEYHRQAFGIFEKLNDRFRMANALNNTGVVYLYLADYPKALEYYLRAVSILEDLHNDNALANSLGNIGIIYKNLANYPKALEYQQRALLLYEKTGNKQGLANTLGNIGVVYDQMKQYSQALEYYQKALLLNRDLGNKKRIASDLTNIGVAYKTTGDYATALSYFDQALELYEASGDRNSTVIALNQLAELYATAPDAVYPNLQLTASARLTKAFDYLQRSLQIAQETGAPDRQSETWEMLSDTYASQGNYKDALHAYRQHILFRDSIYNVENEKKVTRKEMEFEFEKKEALAAARLQRERYTRYLTMGGAALLLITGMIIFIFYKKRRDAVELQQAAEFKAEVADTEMKALRLQMNPHFIFNSLNSISDYITRNDIPQADLYLVKFARLMRMTLENSEQAFVPLATDLEALELYMQLEAVRLNQQFTYRIIIDPDIDPGNTLIPPLLLQPFVENSIIHGMKGKPGEGLIEIQLSQKDGMLQCVIKDNGVGRSQTGAASNKKSMGMQITRSRIDILNKVRHTQADLLINDLTEGTSVTLKLPMELSF